MREHKYRVWSKDLHKMVYFTLGQLLHSYNDEGDYPSIDGTDLFSIHQDINPDEVVESTGLKDRNGKDIYKDDIVRTVNFPHSDHEYDDFDETYEGVVTYDTSDAAYIIVQSGKDYAPMLSNIYIATIEVIGNIYENSDLSEVKQ